MENLSLIILSFFAAIGILLLARLLYLLLFSRELKRSAIVIPFYAEQEPIAETLRAVERCGLRVIAVDMCGGIDRKSYSGLGLCCDFVTPGELGSELFECRKNSG